MLKSIENLLSTKPDLEFANLSKTGNNKCSFNENQLSKLTKINVININKLLNGILLLQA